MNINMSAFVSDHVRLIDIPHREKSGILATYIINGKDSIVIDPGPTVSIPHLINSLRIYRDITGHLKYVAPTHIHLDHAGGSWRLLENFPRATLLVHPKGARHMINPNTLEAGARKLFGDMVSEYGEIKGVPAERVEESKDFQEVDLGGVTVKVIWTPGHATHHQCYFVPEDRVLIVGDAAGIFSSDKGLIIPTTPPPFNPVHAIKSLDVLIDLDPKIICYGHFGYAENALEKLEAHKRQLTLWSNITEQSLAKNMDPRKIFDLIRSEDPMVLDIKYISDMSERSTFISILGFLKYHEWMRGKQEQVKTST
jgi:glyoxylase-like metal-dependent hydrolase (beta-lactamase superfamily II)